MSGPDEAVEMRSALLRLRRTAGLPVAFGGLLDRYGGGCRIKRAEPVRRPRRCAAWTILQGNGLGGKAVALVTAAAR